jgi:hypothetical protein
LPSLPPTPPEPTPTIPFNWPPIDESDPTEDNQSDKPCFANPCGLVKIKFLKWICKNTIKAAAGLAKMEVCPEWDIKLPSIDFGFGVHIVRIFFPIRKPQPKIIPDPFHPKNAGKKPKPKPCVGCPPGAENNDGGGGGSDGLGPPRKSMIPVMYLESCQT